MNSEDIKIIFELLKDTLPGILILNMIPFVYLVGRNILIELFDKFKKCLEKLEKGE